ncbi:MAG: hypothetical protein HY744_30830 [Deltaproteobacteria bacterium]|nr:hypothetical protein [Deltaproteobacteria bacterium]
MGCGRQPALSQNDEDQFGQIRYRAKAYPGLRELQVIRALGPQGIVGSVCPAQLGNWAASDWGYRPILAAVSHRLAPALRNHFCLAQRRTPDQTGRIGCIVIEASPSEEPGVCPCAGKARRELGLADRPLVELAKRDPIVADEHLSCFCEILQAGEIDLAPCQQQVSEPVINEYGYLAYGWCYLDAAAEPPVGNPDLVVGCPLGEERLIRMLGDAQPVPGARLFLACP